MPGPIDRATSAGANRLIQQGAKLVTSAADLLDEMQCLLPEKLPLESTPARTLSLNPSEQSVYNAINEHETSVDEVIRKSGLPPAIVSSTLLALEMKRLVKPLPGQQIIKLL